MSEAAEDPVSLARDNTKWRQAESFIALVRDKQRARGKGMRGRSHLTLDETRAIDVALRNEHLIRPITRFFDSSDGLDSGSIAHQLFSYFNEMCRRNNVIILKENSEYLYFILAVELLANMEHLDASPEKLVAATAQHGILRLHDDDRFAELRDTPEIFRYAASTRSSDPQGFLSKLVGAIDRLRKDDRFANLRDTPSMFARAAASYPTDPEGFLSGVLDAIDRLRKDDRFANLRDTPSIFTRAAVRYPSDPEGFLSGVLDTIDRLRKDDRFANLRDTPGIFTRAAVMYPQNTDAFLKKIQEQGFSTGDGKNSSGATWQGRVGVKLEDGSRSQENDLEP